MKSVCLLFRIILGRISFVNIVSQTVNRFPFVKLNVHEHPFDEKTTSNTFFNNKTWLWYMFISCSSTMKRRSLSGSCGIGLFMVSFICVFIAFATPSWIVSDYRITGAKLDRLGLWTHCFRSLADPNDDYNRRFFVGCRWVFDPFTTGYDEIRGFLIPRKFSRTHFIFSKFI